MGHGVQVPSTLTSPSEQGAGPHSVAPKKGSGSESVILWFIRAMSMSLSVKKILNHMSFSGQ